MDEGETNRPSMVAYTTTSYNTGWMHGNYVHITKNGI